jgi:hypothetical protein
MTLCKTQKWMASFFCLTAALFAGCDGGDVLTDATAVQLETSLISMMNSAVTYVFYSMFHLPLTDFFS